MATIRKNSLKRIAALLNAAVLIRQHHDDGYSARQGKPNTVTAAELLALAKDYGSVNTDSRGTLHISIHSNWFFSAYASWDAVRYALTPEAYEKYRGLMSFRTFGAKALCDRIMSGSTFEAPIKRNGWRPCDASNSTFCMHAPGECAKGHNAMVHS